MMPGMAQESTPQGKKQAVTEAVLAIVAEQGLEHASVREVAGRAGVSIGTVQHYFPTKEGMLAAAYDEVVGRIRARVEALPLGPDIRANVGSVLAQLLPLDRPRTFETRVHLSFAARAATVPDLAATQRRAIGEIHGALAAAFAAAAGAGASTATCGLAAQVALATADGLALHAVSSGGWLPRSRQAAALGLAVDALLAVLGAEPAPGASTGRLGGQVTRGRAGTPLSRPAPSAAG